MLDSLAMKFYQVNRPDVVMESFEGELVLVQMKSGNYYSLQGSAPLIWELIDRGSSIEDIGDLLVERHNDDADIIRRSARDLVDELVAESLLVPLSSAPRPSSAKASSVLDLDAPFVLPVLERYTDMQELLLLDPIHDVDETGWPRRKEQSEG
jgi:Coenzyme PQQ synthesis protein D (PqqD)